MVEILGHKGGKSTIGLLDLPNELLDRIAEYVSNSERATNSKHATLFQLALVNKRLWKTVSPSMLVRHWPVKRHDDFHPPVAFLARHLLYNPQLRTQVRSISLSYADAFSICSELRESEALSMEARTIWLDLATRVNRSADSFEAVNGALTALVLSWTTGITSLDMQVPCYDYNYFLPLVLAADVAMRITAGSLLPTPGGLPLVALRHVDISSCHDRTETIDGKWIAPFFHLPRMKTFVGHLLHLRGDDDESSTDVDSSLECPVDFPSGTSPVEEILLSYTDFTPLGLGMLVHSCRHLRKLAISGIYFMVGTNMSTNALAQIILSHKSSLEELYLDLSECDEHELFEDFRDGAVALEDCFQHLHSLACLNIDVPSVRTSDNSWKVLSLKRLPPRLERLSANVEHVFEEDNGEHRVVDINRLPSSLTALELSGLGSWANFPPYRKRVSRYMDAFQTLMHECGQESRFPKLKDVHLPVVDHHSVEGLEVLKELASINDVELTLEHL
ncbi:hypothetical protein F53441_14261 [Fusarium austroafricanum]|uniref:F-box domain-containing protein n=1 Tax=Fusarium austroafricanum TaxID=2364996 RepID=A0A8H4NFP1_9HYPO|nr:hypothetical protein F53441_14261 [Fusarium austroafricanum]